MDPRVEQYLQDNIFPDLEKGRLNFDKPHTIGVVQKVKDLIKHNPQLHLDEAVLIIVAYAHDWGYSGLFTGGVIADFEKIKNVKSEHMVMSARKLKTLLTHDMFSFLSLIQKDRIVHLVGNHDKLDALKDIDELVFMEADTLGGLDMSFVKPTFDQESNRKYIRGVLQKRLRLFITDYGKKEARRLVKLREEYYKNMLR